MSDAPRGFPATCSVADLERYMTRLSAEDPNATATVMLQISHNEIQNREVRKRPSKADGKPLRVNRMLLAGQQVRVELDVQERDRHGRLLAYVYAGDKMVNAELVRRVYAQGMTVPPNVRHHALFVKLQRGAREQKRGLSADPSEPTTLPSVVQAERQPSGGRPGVVPESAGTCPSTHALKGNFTTCSGERCIYHGPGGQFYDRTKPERCYATEQEAVGDGWRRSKR